MLRVDLVSGKDLEEIAELETQIFSDAWSFRSLAESWEQAERTIIIGAWIAGDLAGYVILYYVLDEGEIARIAVGESFRRQGVGGHLLAKLTDICEEKGIRRLMLEVRKSNTAAISCYRNHGFTENGIRRDYYTEPKEDAVLMSREFGS